MTSGKWAKLRKSLYGAGFALGGVLLVHGVVDQEELDAYLLAVEALLGVAFTFTSDSDGTKVSIKPRLKRSA